MVDLVISSCHSNHIEVWKVAAERLIKFVPSNRYIVVVPDSEVSLFESCSPPQIEVIPESDTLGDLGNALEQKVVNASNTVRKGWYLQQFLKLATLFDHRHLEQVVIWDADTVPLRPIRFFDEVSGSPIYYTSNERHLSYLDCVQCILGLDRLGSETFVAQCFPILGVDIRALHTSLESDNLTWWEVMLNCIDFSLESGFSEYELLGTFVLSRHLTIARQTGKWVRDGKLLWKSAEKIPEVPRILGRSLDFVAFESWHRRTWRSWPRRLQVQRYSILRT